MQLDPVRHHTRPAPAPPVGPPAAPSAEPWERADAILDIDRPRILAFAEERAARDGRGAAVVRLDEPAGSALEWLTYDPRALAAIGVHYNAALGQSIHPRRDPDWNRFQPVVFLGADGRKAWLVFYGPSLAELGR